MTKVKQSGYGQIGELNIPGAEHAKKGALARNADGVGTDKMRIRSIMRALAEQAYEVFQDKEVMSPLEFLIQTYHDPNVEISVRVSAAKTAAEYVHAKVPKQLNVNAHAEKTDTPVPQGYQIQIIRPTDRTAGSSNGNGGDYLIIDNPDPLKPYTPGDALSAAILDAAEE